MATGFLEPLLAAGAAAHAGDPAWLAAARQRALQQLEREGLPGARSEAWKYTSLRALAQRSYQRGDAAASSRQIDPAALEIPGLEGPRMVFVNGVFRADLSRISTIDGLEVEALSSAIARAPDTLREFLDRPIDDSSQAFARLNALLVADGPVVRVAAGAQIEPVVHLVFAGAPAPAELAWQLRCIVDIGAGAALTLVEHHLGEAGQAHFGNVVGQIRLREKARLDLLQVQNAPSTASLVRRSEAVLDDDARLEMRTIEAGALWMRHDLAVNLCGDRARFVSRGAFILRGRQHADTRLDVRHQARDTQSDIVWRGVADERSRGVFHGAITVAAGADGTNAQLSNKNLLLSAQAEIDTQPVLEIHADEVQAAHGATVGQLDEQALFYLRTRGLSIGEARALLTLAFCRVTIDSMESIPLREHVDALLLERLPQGELETGAGESSP